MMNRGASDHRWFSVAEIESEEVRVSVPPGQKWQFRRAVDAYRQWRGTGVTLQPSL